MTQEGKDTTTCCERFVEGPTKYRDVISTDAVAHVWRLLRYHLDTKYTEQRIREVHCIPPKEENTNIKKQAKQIGFCLRQAQEYFETSTRSSMLTRPLMIYYGAVSLCQAVILLKGDGTQSLDARRKNRSARHHGLETSFEEGQIKSKERRLDEVLNAIGCRIYEIHGKPVGNFPELYKSLSPDAYSLEADISEKGLSQVIRGVEVCRVSDHPSVTCLRGTRFSMAELMQTLPDMRTALFELGIPSLARPVQTKTLLSYAKYPEGTRVRTAVREEYDYFVQLSEESETDKLQLQLKHCVPELKKEDTYISVHEHKGVTVHLRGCHGFYEDEPKQTVLPDLLEDLHGSKCILLLAGLGVPEIATYVMCLYCLGMLCRYFPDLWVELMDGNKHMAELCDIFLTAAYLKFPRLILTQMTNTIYHFHSSGQGRS